MPPQPPPFISQWLEDRLTSMQEAQDEFVQSGGMEGAMSWTQRMEAKRLGKK